MASAITDDGSGTLTIAATAVGTAIDYTFFILITIDGGATYFKSSAKTLRMEFQLSNFNPLTIAFET